MSKKKILFTIPNFLTAGSGRALFEVASRLNPNLFEVYVCIETDGGYLKNLFQEKKIPLMVQKFSTSAKPYWSLPFRTYVLSRFFKKYRFDYWHSYHYSDNYTEPLIAKWAGAKFIYTKKNMMWNGRAWKIKSFLSYKIAYQNSTMLEFFKNPILNKKLTHVPRGINFNRFNLDTPKMEFPNIPSHHNRIILGTVSQLVPLKNHITLLEALRSLDSVYLVIAGKEIDLEYTQFLNDKITEWGLTDSVQLIGDVMDVPAFLKSIDIFIHPSKMEGGPVALLEAMSMEKACIATGVTGMLDLVEHGISGLLFPLGDSVALKNHILNLIANPSQMTLLGKNARNRVLQKFPIELEVTRHESLYC